MNTVINHIKNDHTPQVGDIYHDDCTAPGGGMLYILAQIDQKHFSAISLADGNRFQDPVEDKRDAVSGLIFVARNATIMVNLSNPNK